MSTQVPSERPGRWTARNSEGYEAPAALAVDIVVLTVRDGALQVLLVERPEGVLALPGGFVGPAEAAQVTATRKLQEKTGLRNIYLEQLETFTAPGRDPRAWIPTVAHLALVPPATSPDEPAAEWAQAHHAPKLPYDHSEILQAAVDRVAGKLWWSNIAVGILRDPFTLAQARGVYEAIAQRSYDPSTFARDLQATELIEPTNQETNETGGRPARLFRFQSSHLTWRAARGKRIGRPDRR